MSEVRSNKLSDGRDPVELGARIVGLLEGHGFRKRGVDWWTHPETQVTMTVGYASGAYRLRAFPAGQKSGPPVEVVDMAKLAHAERALDLIERWGEWPQCGAPICDAA